MGSDQRRAEEHRPARDRDRAVAHARIDAAYDPRTAAAIAGSDVLYAIAANTDITRTWRRYGWVPLNLLSMVLIGIGAMAVVWLKAQARRTAAA